MKKLFLLLSAMGLLIGLSQCTKPEVQEIAGGNGETQYVKLTTSFDDGSKLNVNEATGQLNLSWQENDEINVVEGGSGTLTCTAVSNGGKTGTFEGTITPTGGNLKFRYGTMPNYTSQDGGAITSSKICLEGTSEYKPSASDYSVSMRLPYAILKLDLHNLVSSTGNVTISVDGEGVKAVVNGVTTSEAAKYVLIPVNSEPASKTYTFYGKSRIGGNTWTLSANTFYTLTDGGGGSSGNPIVIQTTIETDEWINFNDQPGESYGVSGLPIWAKKNIGATNGTTKESWYGNYYAWGETAGYNEAMVGDGASSGDSYSPGTVKTNYTWSWYKWGSGNHSLGKYVSQAGYGMEIPDGISKLELDDDVARQHASWGGTWRMPTAVEWKQLYSSTLWVLTGRYNDIDGLAGYVVYKVKATAHKGQRAISSGNGGCTYSDTEYALTDPHLFLPAAGYSTSTSLYDAGSGGRYWSSSLFFPYPDSACYMGFDSSFVHQESNNNRFYGFTVRSVR